MVYQVYKWEIPKIWKNWMVVLVLIMLLDAVGMLEWMRASVLWAMKPIITTSGNAVSNADRLLRYTQQLRISARENLDLKRQIAELQVLADQTPVLIKENTELRELLAIKPSQDLTGTMARVILNQDGKARVWLDAPVLVGSMVIDRNRLVGVVSQVEGRVGTIDLIGKGDLGQINVRQAETLQPIGNVVMVGSELVVQKLSKQVAVSNGSLLVTVGDGGKIAPNYPVANVKDIIALPESVYQTLKLTMNEQLVPGKIVIVVGGEQ